MNGDTLAELARHTRVHCNPVASSFSNWQKASASLEAAHGRLQWLLSASARDHMLRKSGNANASIQPATSAMMQFSNQNLISLRDRRCRV